MSLARERQRMRVTAVLAGGALFLSLIAHPVRAQENRGEARGQHWVGTWATAVLGRPPAGPPAQQTVPTPTATGRQTSSGPPQNTPAVVPGGSQATPVPPQ